MTTLSYGASSHMRYISSKGLEGSTVQKFQGSKLYALADCNNFFVSCERVFRPDLWNKPVVVLSGNDGCVVSRSNEVKALGIAMGVPLFQIKQEVEEYGITCFSSNFSLYGDLSARVMSILRQHTSRFEQYSIDEAFINIDHVPQEEQKAYCEKLVKRVYKCTGIPISMGIASSKTLAKVAARYAKKYPGYHGVCAIDTEEKRQIALSHLAIKDVWGIGRKARAKLEAAGVHTALEWTEKSALFAQNMLHKPGLMTWKELRGEDCISMTDLPEKQSITTSRTFATSITERGLLEQQIANFCDACARKLRMQHSVCQQVVVYAQSSRFRIDMPMQTISECITLPVATSDTRELLSYVLPCIRRNYIDGGQYKRAGITLMQISKANNVQQVLFDTRDRVKDARLQQTIDHINGLHGKHSIQLATQVASEKDGVVYKHAHQSPLYTTDIHHVIELRV